MTQPLIEDFQSKSVKWLAGPHKRWGYQRERNLQARTQDCSNCRSNRKFHTIPTRFAHPVRTSKSCHVERARPALGRASRNTPIQSRNSPGNGVVFGQLSLFTSPQCPIPAAPFLATAFFKMNTIGMQAKHISAM